MAAGALWRHVDFLRLWAGGTLSSFGAALRNVALPLTAVLTLDANALDMGVLVALQQLPVPLFGLFVGVWLDRVPRRPVMIGAELGRALLLLTVPAAAALGSLGMAQLYAVAFAIGVLTVVFDLGVTSYLPSVVGRENLIDANSKLAMAANPAAIGGRALGGLLVGLVGGPIALLADAMALLAAGGCVARIRTRERSAERGRDRVGGESLWGEIGEGLRFLFGEPALRSVTLASAIGSCGGAVQQAVFLLYATRDLSIGPTWIGLILATGAACGLAGAGLAGPAARRFGPGPVLIFAPGVYALGAALVPLALPGALAVPTLMAAQALMGAGLQLYSVNQISLRQSISPDRLLARVNAGRRVIVFGVIPIGALLGGLLGEVYGLRVALVGSATLAAACVAYSLASPLRTLRSLRV